MKGMLLDDSMSNLTSASNEASLSSSSNKNEVDTVVQQSFANSVAVNNSNSQTQTNKKKRNLPGNPDPEAEVISMSPKTLMATNRFVCEICNKGFQRDQNLQLHRRGHNLPWKLKQRSKQEVVRKKVYVCPEPSCVHHEPARALGDLTGIKKHYSRKHGEKKWKCDKCSKRYAVQSDWKAHSKICGTREYRCDCGTLFSRRDSFITHRAFCGALTGENARSSTSSLLIPNHIPLHLPINFPLKTEPQNFIQPSPLNPHYNINSTTLQQNHLFPSWFNHNNHQQNIISPISPNNATSINNYHLQSPSSPSHMSATALLQKATQIGVIMSKPATSTNTVIVMSQHQQQQQSFQRGSQQHDHMCPPTTLVTAHQHHASDLGDLSSSGAITTMPLHTNSLMALGSNANYQESYSDMLSSTRTNLGSDHFQEPFFWRTSASSETCLHQTTKCGDGGGNGELTRDFLGVTGFPHGDHDYLSMVGLDHLSHSSPYHHQQHDLNHNQNQLPWNV